jgi:hypothetical protein
MKAHQTWNSSCWAAALSLAFSAPGVAIGSPASGLAALKIQDLSEVASGLLQELRFISAATEQWGIENNMPQGATPRPQDIALYIKKGTRLHAELSAGRCTDTLGNSITIGPVGGAPSISKSTLARLSAVTSTEFWGAYLPR